MREALGRILPPRFSLTCVPVARARGGLLDLEVAMARAEGSSGAARTPARLLVCTKHDNSMLLCRSLVRHGAGGDYLVALSALVVCRGTCSLSVSYIAPVPPTPVPGCL